MEKYFYIYILTNQNNTVLYTGITSNLIKRIYEHKEKMVRGFTQKYNLDKLVYFETCSSSISAIGREKQIKSWSRKNKEKLIETINPDWRDLYTDL